MNPAGPLPDYELLASLRSQPAAPPPPPPAAPPPVPAPKKSMIDQIKALRGPRVA